MQELIVGLIGSDEITDSNACTSILKELVGDILKLCKNRYKITFVISNLGDFTILATSVVQKMRRKLNAKNCFIELFVPYETARYKENEDFYQNIFDEVNFTYSDCYKNYSKAALDCNKTMMHKCDFCIFYSEIIQGIVSQTKKFADEKGCLYIDVSERATYRRHSFVE